MAFDREQFEARRAAAAKNAAEIREYEEAAASNVVGLENRKSQWTVQEALAVAARRQGVAKIAIVVEHDDGSTGVLCSQMTRKDLLWLAAQAHEAAICQ